MSFWLGAMQGLTDYRRGEDDRGYKESQDRKAANEKVALTLLESDDPEVQNAGLQILTEALEPPKRKKGVRGSMGQYDQGAGLGPILQLANQFRLAVDPRQPQPPAAPNGAALPGASPIEPKAQGPGASQPPMDPALAAGGGAGAGMETPGSWEALLPAIVESMGGGAAFGGVPLNAPQQAAMDLSTTPSGGLNMGQVAARVSRDRGVPTPGERQRLFWPTKASQLASQTEGQYMAKARVLQQLGATPEQMLQGTMASMGAPSGSPTSSGEEWVILPGQTEPTLAFHYRDPRSGQAFLAVNGPGGQPVPVPPGARRAPPPVRAGGGINFQSRATGQQLIDGGYVEAFDVDPKQMYTVKQVGDSVSILPYTPTPFQGFEFQGAGTDPATGLPLQRSRSGAVSTVPGATAAVPNPKILAARRLIQLVTEENRLSGLGTDIATIRAAIEQYLQSGRFPELAGLSFEQVQMLGDPKMPIEVPDEQLGPILQQRPQTPAATPRTPTGPTRPQSPGTISPPPAASTAPAGGAPPAGWARDVVEQILRERQAQPAPGTVQGRPPR